MSGGSYDYLCFKDAAQVFERDDLLALMAERLDQLPYAKKAAIETRDLLLKVQALKTEIESALASKLVSTVWYAVEWRDSGDIGEDQLKDALKEYNG